MVSRSQETPEELASRLALLRRRAGLSGHALGAKLGLTQASVSRIESGLQRPAPQVVEQWGAETGASAEERKELWQLLEQVLTDYTSHRVRHAKGVGTHQRNVKSREAEVSCIRVCQPALVPGLLQTQNYARHIFSLGPASLSEDEIRESLEARQERQGQLLDETRTFEFLIFESALWATFAPKRVMTEQFRHIARLSTFPNVWIGVVPQATQLPAVPVCAFQMYDEDLVTVEALTGITEVQEPEDVAVYLRLFDQWADLAVHGDDLSGWIEKFSQRYTRLSA